MAIAHHPVSSLPLRILAQRLCRFRAASVLAAANTLSNGQLAVCINPGFAVGSVSANVSVNTSQDELSVPLPRVHFSFFINTKAFTSVVCLR